MAALNDKLRLWIQLSVHQSSSLGPSSLGNTSWCIKLRYWYSIIPVLSHEPEGENVPQPSGINVTRYYRLSTRGQRSFHSEPCCSQYQYF